MVGIRLRQFTFPPAQRIFFGMDTQKYKGTNTMLTGRRKMAQLKRIEDIGAHEINRKSETADTAAKSAKRKEPGGKDRTEASL